jgi:hypothetical protein
VSLSGTSGFGRGLTEDGKTFKADRDQFVDLQDDYAKLTTLRYAPVIDETGFVFPRVEGPPSYKLIEKGGALHLHAQLVFRESEIKAALGEKSEPLTGDEARGAAASSKKSLFDDIRAPDKKPLPAARTPHTIQSFADVETDQTSVECQLRENAMPLGRNKELAERNAGQSKKRSRPKRDPAKRLLQKMFPSGLPSKDELPDQSLFAKCKGPEWNAISDDTISRAAAEVRDGKDGQGAAGLPTD